MEDYQREFLEFAIERNVLRFGEFTLKSGRISPYFFNTGLFDSGECLARLGSYYATSIVRSGIDFDLLYGPAYKGIPLAAATTIALANEHDRDVPYAFNRKEKKDHGEGGLIVGAPLEGRVLVIDDVISAGTSVRESVNIIRHENAELAGVVISLNRQERGVGEISAVTEVERDFNVPVISIANLEQIIELLQSKPDCDAHLDKIKAYRAQYGE